MNKKVISIYKDEYILREYRIYLNDLYLPIIGAKGVLLYLFLLDSETKKIKESLLLNKLDLSYEEYLNAIKVLTAIDLIEYYVSRFNEDDVLIYVNPLLPPSMFLARYYLKELLKEGLKDEEEYNRILTKYQDDLDLTNYEINKVNFLDVFKVDLKKDESFDFKEEYIYSFKNKLKLNKEKDDSFNFNFSYAIFLKEVRKRSSFDINLILNKDEEKIERLARIYDAKEDEMAELVVRFIRLENKLDVKMNKSIINYNKIEEALIKRSAFRDYSLLNNSSNNNNNSKLLNSNYESILYNKDVKRSDLINYYLTVSPLTLLKDSLKGKEPSLMDKKVIARLSNDYSLNREMINCIIHYALKRDNNHLYINNIINYLTPLLRNNVKDVYEMMECLYQEKDIKVLEEDIKNYSLYSSVNTNTKNNSKTTKNSSNKNNQDLVKDLTKSLVKDPNLDEDIDLNLGLNDNDYDF